MAQTLRNVYYKVSGYNTYTIAASSSGTVTVNGKTYNADMPVLNYQGRTYLALRELGTVTGNEVDFVDNNIIINNINE